MLIPDLYKPIRNFGYFFLAIGLCGFLVLITKLQNVEQMFAIWLFIGSVSLFHLLLGIAVIIKSSVGFWIFKDHLSIAKCFPKESQYSNLFSSCMKRETK